MFQQSRLDLDHSPGSIEHDTGLSFIRRDDEHLRPLDFIGQQRIQPEHGGETRLAIATRHRD